MLGFKILIKHVDSRKNTSLGVRFRCRYWSWVLC